MGRIFSGIQPSGDLHIGNYLGAIKNWVALQDVHETIFCIVDWHAMTLPWQAEDLKKQTHHMVAALLACGIDPKKSILFRQSDNPDHTELAWIFNCVARMGWLNRMTQFKEKAGQNSENSSVGLFVYPALMAADILAYKATHVPVGEDQKQHLELARDIAQKFNYDFSCDFFPLPEPLIPDAAARIMSLRDGTQKMSKSDPSDYSRITLVDSSDEIALKIRKARTDSDPMPSKIEGLKGRAEVNNLVTIYSVLSGKEVAQVLAKYAGENFSVFKAALADMAVAHLAPITERMRGWLDNPNQLDAVLCEGREKARKLSKPVLAETRYMIGLSSG